MLTTRLPMTGVILIARRKLVERLAVLLLEVAALALSKLELGYLLVIENVGIDVSLVDVEHSRGWWYRWSLRLIVFISCAGSITGCAAVLLASSGVAEGQLRLIFGITRSICHLLRTSRTWLGKGIEWIGCRLCWKVPTDACIIMFSSIFAIFELSWHWGWYFSGSILSAHLLFIACCWRACSTVLAPRKLQLHLLHFARAFNSWLLRRTFDALYVLLLFESLNYLLLLVALWLSCYLLRCLTPASMSTVLRRLSLEYVRRTLGSGLYMALGGLPMSISCPFSLRRLRRSLWTISMVQRLSFLYLQSFWLFLCSCRCLRSYWQTIRSVEEAITRRNKCLIGLHLQKRLVRDHQLHLVWTNHSLWIGYAKIVWLRPLLHNYYYIINLNNLISNYSFLIFSL